MCNVIRVPRECEIPFCLQDATFLASFVLGVPAGPASRHQGQWMLPVESHALHYPPRVLAVMLFLAHHRFLLPDPITPLSDCMSTNLGKKARHVQPSRVLEYSRSRFNKDVAAGPHSKRYREKPVQSRIDISTSKIHDTKPVGRNLGPRLAWAVCEGMESTLGNPHDERVSAETIEHQQQIEQSGNLSSSTLHSPPDIQQGTWLTSALPGSDSNTARLEGVGDISVYTEHVHPEAEESWTDFKYDHCKGPAHSGINDYKGAGDSPGTHATSLLSKFLQARSEIEHEIQVLHEMQTRSPPHPREILAQMLIASSADIVGSQLMLHRATAQKEAHAECTSDQDFVNASLSSEPLDCGQNITSADQASTKCISALSAQGICDAAKQLQALEQEDGAGTVPRLEMTKVAASGVITSLDEAIQGNVESSTSESSVDASHAEDDGRRPVQQLNTFNRQAHIISWRMVSLLHLIFPSQLDLPWAFWFPCNSDTANAQVVPFMPQLKGCLCIDGGQVLNCCTAASDPELASCLETIESCRALQKSVVYCFPHSNICYCYQGQTAS